MKWTEKRVKALAAALEAAQCPDEEKAACLLVYERSFFKFLGECRWEMNYGLYGVRGNMDKAKAVVLAFKPDAAPTALTTALATCSTWMCEQLTVGLQPGLTRLVTSHPQIGIVFIDAMVSDLEQSWGSIACLRHRVDWMLAEADLQPRG